MWSPLSCSPSTKEQCQPRRQTGFPFSDLDLQLLPRFPGDQVLVQTLHGWRRWISAWRATFLFNTPGNGARPPERSLPESPLGCLAGAGLSRSAFVSEGRPLVGSREDVMKSRRSWSWDAWHTSETTGQRRKARGQCVTSSRRNRAGCADRAKPSSGGSGLKGTVWGWHLSPDQGLKPGLMCAAQTEPWRALPDQGE